MPAKLLELPMHIQDGALFFQKAGRIIRNPGMGAMRGDDRHSRQFGGVLTVLWHDRSFGPERFWGDFYIGWVERLNHCRSGSRLGRK